MAKQAGITGKNTLDKMKQLNKFVKTSQGVKFRNTFYDIKDDVIIAEVRSKKRRQPIKENILPIKLDKEKQT